MEKKEKIATEASMRRGILRTAKAWGVEKEVRQIFDRYDRLLKNCTDPTERYQIGVMGAADLHRFLNCKGALVIGGELIIPAAEEIIS